MAKEFHERDITRSFSLAIYWPYVNLDISQLGINLIKVRQKYVMKLFEMVLMN